MVLQNNGLQGQKDTLEITQTDSYFIDEETNQKGVMWFTEGYS